jgi:hypothetical protein
MTGPDYGEPARSSKVYAAHRLAANVPLYCSCPRWRNPVAARPTARWRVEIQEDAAAIAAGTLSPDEAVASSLWSEYLLTHTDSALDGFETAVMRLSNPSDDQVMATVQGVMLSLNRVNADLRDRDETPYETDERENLCAYIDQTLVEAGIDLDALAVRLGISRNEIGDEWRER